MLISLELDLTKILSLNPTAEITVGVKNQVGRHIGTIRLNQNSITLDDGLHFTCTVDLYKYLDLKINYIKEGNEHGRISK